MARNVTVSINHIIIILKAMRLTECSWHQKESQKQNSGILSRQTSYSGGTNRRNREVI